MQVHAHLEPSRGALAATRELNGVGTTPWPATKGKAGSLDRQPVCLDAGEAERKVTTKMPHFPVGPAIIGSLVQH